MGDAYKHDPDGVLNVISALKDKTSTYSDKIVELTNLVNTINGSSAWKDVEIKTSFIDTCNSYITIYNNLILALDVYIDYLNKKSESGAALESTYAGG